MNKIKWLIQDFAYDDSIKELTTELSKQNIEFKLTSYDILKVYNEFDPYDYVVVYGSMNMLRKVIQEFHNNNVFAQTKWITWFTLKNYDCLNYYPYVSDYLFNKDYIALPLVEISKRYNDRELFIRPNSGYKFFSARVFNSNDLDHIRYLSAPNTTCIIAEPKKILSEYRFVCIKDYVISGSQYKLDGEFNESIEFPKEAEELAKHISSIYQPDSVFVVDICKGEDGKYYLMEMNSFCCAGLYTQSNIPNIVKVVSGIAQEEYDDLYTFPRRIK